MIYWEQDPFKKLRDLVWFVIEIRAWTQEMSK